jgi:hypothetical protein
MFHSNRDETSTVVTHALGLDGVCGVFGKQQGKQSCMWRYLPGFHAPGKFVSGASAKAGSPFRNSVTLLDRRPFSKESRWGKQQRQRGRRN